MSDLNKVSILLLSLTLSIIFSIFSSFYIMAFLGVIIIITLIQFKNSNLLLIPITIGYLSFTSELFASIRPIIILITTTLLIYLFLKKYGFKFSSYPKIPKGLVYFFVLLFITLLISTIFSEFLMVSLFASIRTIFFFAIIYFFYALIETEYDYKILIFILVLVMLIIGIPMLIDLYNLGFQKYFIKNVLNENMNLYTIKGYTGMTHLFISSGLIITMFFLKEFINNRSKLTLTILLMLNVIFLILSNSRGGILAAIISAVFILIIIKKMLFIKSFLLIAIFIVSIYLLIPSVNESINLYMRWETVSDREVYWQMGLDVIKDYSFFGAGPDTFDKIFFNYAPSSTISYFKIGDLSLGKPHPHNFFLYFTSENGVLGFITSISFFVIIFYYSIKTIKLTNGNNKTHYYLALVITGIFIGLFFRAFIEVAGFLIYGYLTLDLPIWLLIVLLLSIHNKYHKSTIGSEIKSLNAT